VAAAMGIVGGFFFPSVNSMLRIIGAILWCVGNVLWIIFAKAHGKWAMFTVQVIYMLQNIFAIWNISSGELI